MQSRNRVEKMSNKNQRKKYESDEGENYSRQDNRKLKKQKRGKDNWSTEPESQ